MIEGLWGEGGMWGGGGGGGREDGALRQGHHFPLFLVYPVDMPGIKKMSSSLSQVYTLCEQVYSRTQLITRYAYRRFLTFQQVKMSLKSVTNM